MIIENHLMWPPTCNRWRLDDEFRGAFDALLHTVHIAAASEILVTPSPFMKEVPPLHFYDKEAKIRLYNEQVKPLLQAVFHPKVAHGPFEDPWEIDDSYILGLMWEDLVDFLTTLIWCSKLRIAFVFDLEGIRRPLTVVRNSLVSQGKLADHRMLNDLFAILNLFKATEVWCFTPTESSRGNALDIWKQLRKYPLYRRISQETRRLGFFRLPHVQPQLDSIRTLAERAMENPFISSAVSLAQIGISLFAGPACEFASHFVSKLSQALFSKRFVPPVYSLKHIEQSFDRTYYPERLREVAKD